jgi:hypothetical protein
MLTVLSSFMCCFPGVNFNKRNQDDGHDYSEGGHDDEEEQKALLGLLRTPQHLLAYQNTM